MPKKRKRLPTIRCDAYTGGLCQGLGFAVPQTGLPVRCPRPRAENLEPGECCHHPMRDAVVKKERIKKRFRDLKAGRVKLSRYKERMKGMDLDQLDSFTSSLWEAFLRARSKRRKKSPLTSGKS